MALLSPTQCQGITPEQSLADLRAGNARFLSETPLRPNADALRRQTTARHGQYPKAVVLACSDSRIPVELIFDQGIGDIFVVRVAGNGVTECVLGSIEYGVQYLQTPLVVIMGHTGCGAIETVCTCAPVSRTMETLLAPLVEAAAHAKARRPEDRGFIPPDDHRDVETLAAIDNIRHGVALLPQKIPAVAQGLREGTLLVAGCLYHTESGDVEWLD